MLPAKAVGEAKCCNVKGTLEWTYPRGFVFVRVSTRQAGDSLQIGHGDL